uniref:Uncharacterized protein n=1 Tax=viral metagenome TaxID=1070528 RepID=A0A6C0CSP6_9ZZZZ
MARTTLVLYGLSANPPTLAHKAIIEHIVELYRHCDFWIIPTFRHPIKTNLIDFNHRVNMLNLMCDYNASKLNEYESEYGYFYNGCVSRIEETVLPTCSNDLIEFIRSHYEYTDIIYVCDYTIIMDIFSLKRMKSLELIHNVSFHVILNHDNDMERDIIKINNSINELELEKEIDVSYSYLRHIDESIRSTEVRNASSEKQRASLLDDKVYDYLTQHGIIF